MAWPLVARLSHVEENVKRYITERNQYRRNLVAESCRLFKPVTRALSSGVKARHRPLDADIERERQGVVRDGDLNGGARVASRENNLSS